MPNSLKASGRRVFHRKYFSPIELSGVEAWYDASDTSAITESSNQVSQWNDTTGNGWHLTQGNSSAQPLTNTVTINGLNTILFDNDASSDGDQMVISGNPTTGSDDLSLFFVVKQTALPTTGSSPFLFNGGAGTSRFLAHAPWTGGQFIFDIAGTGAPNRIFAPGAVTAGEELISNFVVESGASPNGKQQIWKNGSVLVEDDSGETFTRGTNMVIGTRSHLAIGEFLLIHGIVTQSDRQKTEGYLAHKWGQTGSLPSDHPYKNNKP